MSSETGNNQDQPRGDGGNQPASSEIPMPNEQTPIQGGTNLYSFGLIKRPMRYDPLMVIFTVLIFAGGIAGYVTKGSSVSLISGTLFFFLLAAGTYIEGIRRNSYPLLAILLALGTMMGYRYSQSMNFMPSGLIALLSFLMFARHAYILYLRRTDSS